MNNPENSNLDNSGEFHVNYARLMNLKFSVVEGIIQVLAEEGAGEVRQLVCNTINDAQIKLNGEAHRFEYLKDDTDAWTRARTYTRKLKNSNFDMDTGELTTSEKVVDCLGGTFRLPIDNTNIIVANISVSSGFEAWVWTCHPDYQSGTNAGDNKDNDSAPDVASSVKEI